MSSSVFKVVEHSAECQHIREYHGGIRPDAPSLSLCVKEYIPLNNIEPEEGSITIIATHANGFPKEVYEPLFEELVHSAAVKVRGIWIADCAHQGQSGVVNEDSLGDDTSWFDHSRDLLSLVNQFRKRIVPPVFGIGHSMGCAQLVRLSILHPRLLYGVALIEPVIQDSSPPGPNASLFSTFRKDIWPSKAKFEESVMRNPFFKTFDPRVMKRYTEFGVRPVPTKLYPVTGTSKIPVGAVTLTTTKHQEAWSYVRANIFPLPSSPDDPTERLIVPDLDAADEGTLISTRPESMLSLHDLSHLRPGVLWIYGEESFINSQDLQDEKMRLTGTGRGGSGGVKLGRVEQQIIQDAGHLAPIEKVSECAGSISKWLGKELTRFRQDEEFFRSHGRRVSSEKGLAVSKEWIEIVQMEADSKRPIKEKL